DGTKAGSGADGLTISGGNSTVKALVVNRFSGNGIVLNTSGGDLISGCYLGTNSAGTSAAANGGANLLVQSGNNTIGGTALASHNLISGGLQVGLDISGAAATGNLVEGNR